MARTVKQTTQDAHRRRRGRYRRSAASAAADPRLTELRAAGVLPRAFLPAADDGADAAEIAEIERQIAGVRAESPMKHEQSREVLVSSLRGLLLERARLERLTRSGRITAEESKTVPAIANQIRRVIEQLGVVEHRDPDEEEEL